MLYVSIEKIEPEICLYSNAMGVRHDFMFGVKWPHALKIDGYKYEYSCETVAGNVNETGWKKPAAGDDIADKVWLSHVATDDGINAKGKLIVRAYQKLQGENGEAIYLMSSPAVVDFDDDDLPSADGFRNESDNEFVDISSEASRTYNFGQKGFVKVNKPLKLSVSASGGHRIFTADGNSHYIPSGWIQLSWIAKDGEPHFVK